MLIHQAELYNLWDSESQILGDRIQCVTYFERGERHFCHCDNKPAYLLTSVVTGRARLMGFRVGFAGQNPSLGTLRLSGFGPFRASGFFGLLWAISGFSSPCLA